MSTVQFNFVLSVLWGQHNLFLVNNSQFLENIMMLKCLLIKYYALRTNYFTNDIYTYKNVRWHQELNKEGECRVTYTGI